MLKTLALINNISSQQSCGFRTMASFVLIQIQIKSQIKIAIQILIRG
jgi:hypothetical protein